MKQEYYFSSLSGMIHCCKWQANDTPIGIIQIIHGIKEYVGRYEEMASYFAQKGYLVVGADHPGHGKSVSNEGQYGYMQGGWKAAVKNIHLLRNRMQREYPDIPYIMYGHSMGSFLLTTYLSVTKNAPDAAVVSGTGWMPSVVLSAGRTLCKLQAMQLGAHASSSLLKKLTFGPYNARIRPAETEFDWLTNDADVVQAYICDPQCNWDVSIQLFDEMFRAMQKNQRPENLMRIDKKLPLFFIAGQDDPVGSYGNGVLTAVQAFKDAGIEDVTVELYPHMRHECHNEKGKVRVFEDVLSWIETRIPARNCKGCIL